MSRKVFWCLISAWALVLTVSAGCGALSGAAPSGGENTPPVLTAAPLPTPTLSESNQMIPMQPVLPSIMPTAQSEAQPAILEARRLTLEWPPVLRAGDGDIIRLTVEIDEEGNLTPTAEFEGHLTTGQTIQIPDVYATHNVIAEARLDLAGMVIQPSEMTSRPMRPGQGLVFYWSIRPAQAARYRGVVWFYLRFVPLAAGPEREQAVAAFPVEIEVVSLLGLKAGAARILGVVGAFVSSILGVPFLEDLLRWILKRFKSS